MTIKEQLEDAGELEVVESDYFGRIQKRYLAKRNPDVSQFSVDEIVVIDDVLSKIGDLNGSEASDFSHQFPAWKTAADREELPFYTFFLSTSTPTDKDIEWAKAEMKRCLQ